MPLVLIPATTPAPAPAPAPTSTSTPPPLPIPLTDGDHGALLAQPPHHVADLTVGDRRVWIARYDAFPHPLVSVWAPHGFVFASVHVWFPGATARVVRDWAATLPVPKPVPVKVRAA